MASLSTIVQPSVAPVRRNGQITNLKSGFLSSSPNFKAGSLLRNKNNGLDISPKFSSIVRSSETAQRPPETDVMGLLLRQRIVFLGSQVDDFVADAVVSQLLLLDAQDPKKTIRLFLNCSGGPMSAIMAIFDAIQLCQAPVATIGFGIVASTATLLLAGGSPGLRSAMPNTRIMMHQPLGGASGQAIDVEIQAKEVITHKLNMMKIYAEITRRPVDQIKLELERDMYLSPVQAMERGIIDNVLDQDTIIPLQPIPERKLLDFEYIKELQDPMTFLRPNVPDEEIF